MKTKFELFHENAAGIDIGSRSYYVSIGDGTYQVFSTYTSGCRGVIEYLKANKIMTVAMESTGIYWVSLYEMLEEAEIDVWLVNGRETKNVPGRKSDIADCQWIQQLHSYGLLRKSFIVNENIRPLKHYNRLRQDHIRAQTTQIHLMQKALTQMNIRLSETINDIMGVSGRKMIEAILKGERDKEVLVSMCHKSILKNKREEVLLALEGFYKEEHLFALKQAYDTYNFYEDLISGCETEMEKVLKSIVDEKSVDQQEHKEDTKNNKRKPVRDGLPIEDLDTYLLKMTDGKDPVSIPGITDYGFLQIVSEIGTDLKMWQNSKHFTSWLGLAPKKSSSGKTRKKVRKTEGAKAGQLFKTVAYGVLNSKKDAIGAFGRRIKARRGSSVAIKAMARKIATFYYNVMQKGTEYVEKGIELYETKLKQQKLNYLKKAAKEFELELVPLN